MGVRVSCPEVPYKKAASSSEGPQGGALSRNHLLGFIDSPKVLKAWAQDTHILRSAGGRMPPLQAAVFTDLASAPLTQPLRPALVPGVPWTLSCQVRSSFKGAPY